MQKTMSLYNERIQKGREIGIGEGIEKVKERYTLDAFDNGFTLEQTCLFIHKNPEKVKQILKDNNRTLRRHAENLSFVNYLFKPKVIDNEAFSTFRVFFARLFIRRSPNTLPKKFTTTYRSRTRKYGNVCRTTRQNW